MLKLSYDKLEDIPENMRGAYVQKDGKYVLDELSADHPVLVNNATLKTEKSAAIGRATTLQNQVTELSTKSVPEGHVVIPVADKQLLDEVKPLGDAKFIKERVTGYEPLKQKAEAADREQKLTQVAEILGFNPKAFAALSGLPAADAFEVRDKTENGQPVKNAKGEVEKVVIVRLDENGQKVEKNFRDHFDSTPGLKMWEASLAAAAVGSEPKGRQMPSQTGSVTAGATGDPVKDRLAARDQQRTNNPNPLMAPHTAVASAAGQPKQQPGTGQA
jgi:hypothetical protein